MKRIAVVLALAVALFAADVASARGPLVRARSRARFVSLGFVPALVAPAPVIVAPAPQVVLVQPVRARAFFFRVGRHR